MFLFGFGFGFGFGIGFGFGFGLVLMFVLEVCFASLPSLSLLSLLRRNRSIEIERRE